MAGRSPTGESLQVEGGARRPSGAAPSAEELAAQLAGLDALEAVLGRAPSRARRAWSVLWPKLAAVVIGLTVWQVVVWTHWKPEYGLPGPRRVLSQLGDLL